MAGPIPMRMGLVKSKNLVSIRILKTIGTDFARHYIAKFGFDPEKHPPYLTMALGAGSVTAMEMVRAYSVFANGGYLVQPFYIRRIMDGQGQVIFDATPQRAGSDAPRTIEARNAFVTDTLLMDVVRRGTAARAMSLGRSDLAGKTGTTNDHRDAWFAGFQPTLAAVAWMGYDQPRPMGGSETGAAAALPIWMRYMQRVLAGVPEASYVMPEGVVTAMVDPLTGLRVVEGHNGVQEYFFPEFLPPEEGGAALPAPVPTELVP
jgi:penicillin-binding protein 1A